MLIVELVIIVMLIGCMMSFGALSHEVGNLKLLLHENGIYIPL